MIEYDDDSESCEKSVKLVKACTVCPVKWVPWSLETMANVPQVENTF